MRRSETPLRVLLLTYSYLPAMGGVEFHVANEAEALRSRGHSVEVRLANVASIWRLAAGSRAFDVVHAHGARKAWVAAGLIVGRMRGHRVVFTPHCYYPSVGWKRVLKAVFDSTIGVLAHHAAHAVVSLTADGVADVRRHGRVDASSVVVIPNGIDCERLERYEVDLPRRKLLLSVGRLDRVKRIDVVLRAMSCLPDYDLVVVGKDAGAAGDLHLLSQELGLERRVRFLESLPLEELVQLYCQAAALLMTSTYEGLPTVLLEAMLLRVPVITTNVGGISELVSAGVVTAVVEPVPESVCSAVHGLREGKAVLESARRLVCEKYDWRAVSGALVRLYFEGVSGVSGSRLTS